MQVYQTVLLLKKLWPEGSDIRRVICVLTCAVGLKLYSDALESAHASLGAKPEQSESVSIFKISFQNSDYKHVANKRDAFSRCQEDTAICFLLLATRSLVQTISRATASPKEHHLSVGTTMPHATVTIQGENFTLTMITSMGCFTVEHR